MTEAQIVTRRARALEAFTNAAGFTDKATLNGLSFRGARVFCTLGDIGDPRFRLWLAEVLTPRLTAPLSLKLEIVA